MPPNRDVEIHSNKLVVSEIDKETTPLLPADRFMTLLANTLAVKLFVYYFPLIEKMGFKA